MTDLRSFEWADHIGCLDDAAFGVDAGGDADALREAVRNTNAFVGRGRMIYRWLGAAHGVYGEAPGGGWGYAWPIWQYCLPIPLGGVPVPKKPGITKARVILRGVFASGKTFNFAMGSIGRPFASVWPSTEYLSFTGTGSSQRPTVTEFTVREGGEESLSFYLRGNIDPAADSLMVTATYGGTNTGTVTNSTVFGTRAIFYSGGATWNVAGSQVDKGGHYVVFTAANDGRILWGPCPILDIWRGPANAGSGLYYGYPVPPEGVARSLTNQTYTIYKLPDYRLTSIAVYGKRRVI